MALHARHTPSWPGPKGRAGMPKENWSSRLSFVLSGAALAVGVANFWRFPYLIGRYGGGTFLLAYVAVAILFGVPLVAMELALGRHTRREATGALALLAPRSPWPLLGEGDGHLEAGHRRGEAGQEEQGEEEKGDGGAGRQLV